MRGIGWGQKSWKYGFHIFTKGRRACSSILSCFLHGDMKLDQSMLVCVSAYGSGSEEKNGWRSLGLYKMRTAV